MPTLKVYRASTLAKFITPRPGETKLGEKLKYLTSGEELAQSKVEFVLLGIPEDIGVRANYGTPGTSEAWNAFLKAFLNIQHNQFISAEKLLILGEVDCSEEMEKASLLEVSDPNYYIKLGELVGKIDTVVSSTVRKILSAGKTPIIIGGGHNNAFGNIKGTAAAFGSAINVLNIDAHTDLRYLEHRHSGNGFNYALQHEYLKKYAVFGLQQNYTPQYIYEKMESEDDFAFFHFEDVHAEGNLQHNFQIALEFVHSHRFGLEVDCDVIAGFPSSASSPSGFSLDQVRSLIKTAAADKNCSYLHLCEASVRAEYPTGKALSFLASDFIKNRQHKETMKIDIIPFDPAYTENFKQLNIEWLEKYFHVEPRDEEVLGHPLKHIIEPGGHIFLAKVDEEIVGSVALIKLADGVFELSKMAVTPMFQGQKIGQKLLQHSIDFAKQQGWQELILYSNRSLESAIYLYLKFGFEEVEIDEDNPYARGDIKMRLPLS